MVEAMVCGYREYRSVWENPAHGEQLSCVKEPGNPLIGSTRIGL